MTYKNLIFVCVFNAEKYLHFFYLLLESIQLFGNLKDNTDILVYTSSNFGKRIKESHFYKSNILFYTNDSYDTTDKAAKARLDLFDIPIVQNYQKILYLDTDIIIRRSLQPVFDLIQDISKPLLYTLKEGSIDHPKVFWGRYVFNDEIHNYKDKSAFTTGMLLFANHPFLKKVFYDVKEHIHKNIDKGFYDQGHIIYHAFKHQIYDNILLEKYAQNENGIGHPIDTKKTILHFCGGLGVPKDKQMRFEFMQQFIFQTKERLINHFISETQNIINSTLLPIIKNTGEKLEGNIFTEHETFQLSNSFHYKRKNISSISLIPHLKKGLEIGFNSGFSTLLMLISNPKLQMTCIDLGEHSYVNPCYEAINKIFPDRITLLIGNSKDILPTLEKEDYDFIHIDGSHNIKIIDSDIQQSYQILKRGGFMICNNYNIQKIKNIWNKNIQKYSLQKLHFYTYKTPFHDIKYK